MSMPYAAYTRKFTARLQARLHKQSYANVMQQMERRSATPAGNVADSRMSELQSLVAQHARTFDPTFRTKALSILQTLPLKSTEEDPHFSYALAGLRVCAHFGAVNAPATFNLINHITRHTFLMDGYTVFLFSRVLTTLRHPQTAEIVQILLPRIREVQGEFSISEARFIMEFLATQKMLDPELTRGLAAVMEGGLQDVTVWELARCVGAVHMMGSTEVARKFLMAAAPRICQVLQESVVQRHYYKSLYFADTRNEPLVFDSAKEGEDAWSPSAKQTAEQASKAQLRAFLLEEQKASAHLLFELPRIVSFLAWGPRQVLNEMVRTAVAWSEPTTLTPSRNHASDGVEAGLGSSSQNVGSTFSEAEKRDYEAYVQTLPQLGRRHLSSILKALHFASYRHPAGLRLLSARITSIEPKATDAASALVKDDLPLAMEAAAYFYATDCIPAVVSMVEEVQASELAPVNARIQAQISSEPNSMHLLTREDRNTAEVIALRTLLSCNRLLSACNATAGSQDKGCSLPSSRPVDPAMKKELCKHIAALATSPLLQLYLDYAKLLARQETSLADFSTRRHFTGAAHVLHSIAVLFQAIKGDGKEEDFVARASAMIDTALVEKLRANMRELTQLVRAVAEKHPDNLPKELVTEVLAALEMVQKHPKWLPDV